MPVAPIIVPPPLAPGARVALIAPAGPLTADDLDRATATTRSLGWIPQPGTHVLARSAYFAGTDADRLADLNAAIRDPSVDAIWCLRGGYGAMRLLDGVDYDTLARRPRALIGYSDITALHCAIAARVPGLVSFHGPTARAPLPPFSRTSLTHAVAAPSADPCGSAPHARALRAGSAHGHLAGGNLALLAALVGTQYAPRFAGAIVVLEDVNEPVYRVDRMLRQLWLAGTFAGCRAIVFGHCTNCPEPCDDDGRRTLADVVLELAAALDVPAALGVPVGHLDAQWTLPLGASAQLTAGSDGCALHVEWPATPRTLTPPHYVASGGPVTVGALTAVDPPSSHPAMKSAADLVADAKQRVREVSPEDVQLMRARDEPITIVDVREPAEWAMGRVPGAVAIARGVLEATIEARVPRDARIVVYCGSGMRSALAADTLQTMGYADVTSMRGGIRGWTDAGGELEG